MEEQTVSTGIFVTLKAYFFLFLLYAFIGFSCSFGWWVFSNLMGWNNGWGERGMKYFMNKLRDRKKAKVAPVVEQKEAVKPTEVVIDMPAEKTEKSE